MAQGNDYDYEMWTRFVEADYLIDAKTYEGKCPTCNSPRDCNNYYCLQCKVGGLCPMTFRGKGAHTHHRWLQVRRQSHKSAVDPEELANYLPHESIKHIQKCLLNTGSLCYLRTDHHHHQASASSSRPPAKRAKTGGRGQPSPLKSCEACHKAIANSQDCKEDFLLCSVECLITLNQRQPGRNLLRMRDGALAPTNDFPRTALEKIKGRLTTTGSSSKSGSRARDVIEDRSGRGSSSGGGGENVAAEEVTRTPATAVRGSSGRRSAPVNYRALHRGGAAGTAAGSSRTAGTRVGGATTAARTRDSSRGRSSRRGPASRTQAAPDYSAYPLGYQSVGLHNLIEAVQANGDWDLYLGDLGRD